MAAVAGEADDLTMLLQLHSYTTNLVSQKGNRSTASASAEVEIDFSRCLTPVFTEQCAPHCSLAGLFGGFAYVTCCILDVFGTPATPTPGDRTLTQEVESRCPPKVLPPFECFYNELIDFYQRNALVPWMLTKFGIKGGQSAYLNNRVVDQYSVGFYLMTLLASVTNEPQSGGAVRPPHRLGDELVETLTIGRITVPVGDVDTLESDAPQGALPKAPLDNIAVCLAGPVLHSMTSHDLVSSPRINKWDVAMRDWCSRTTFWWDWARCQQRRKEEWVLSLWDPYSMKDGTPVWPRRDVNFASHFWRRGVWEDGLEQAFAFSSMGTHRVTLSDKVYGGEPLPFLVGLNSYSELPVHPGLGKYGADMYFTEDGIPALIVTPDGAEVLPGSKDWQYWKFVWRSTLFSVVTLEDHLHMSHYKVANALAMATRDILPPTHPLRRFMTIFTFNSIYINYISMFLLSGNAGALDRACPFADHEAVGMTVSATIPDIAEKVKYFVNDTMMQQLPPTLKDAPYYADGKLFYDALATMAMEFLEVYRDEWCDPEDDTLTDPHIKKFLGGLREFYNSSEYVGNYSSYKTCTVGVQRLIAALYTVTAYHRHVGQVGSMAADPDLVAFSWLDGESHSRPVQALLMSNIAAFTGAPKPKLIEDYTQVFQGIHKEAQAAGVFRRFREEMVKLDSVLAERNDQREIPYTRAMPAEVEISVAI